MGCDINFEEDLKKLSDIVETVHDFYEASYNRLKNEEPNEEHKDIVQNAKEIYDKKKC